jgi:hypothetical protein
MVIDHIGVYFMGNNIWFRIIGRMAAPQFFFLIGYSGSYRFKRSILFYGIALFVVNFLTYPGTSITARILPINILLSFVIIKALLNRFDVAKFTTNQLIMLLAILMLFSFPSYLLIEYGTLGLCYAIGARLLSQRHSFSRFWIFITVIVQFGFESVFLIIGHTQLSIHYIPYIVVMLLVVFCINLVIFLNHRFRVFHLTQKFVKTIALYISRYSLEIYFFHLSAFKIAYFI